MKKVLTAILASSLLLMPLPVYASDSTKVINQISFDKLQEEIIARNPTVKTLDNEVSSMDYFFKDKQGSMEIGFNTTSLVALRDNVNTELNEDNTALAAVEASLLGDPANAVLLAQQADLEDQIDFEVILINFYQMQIAAMSPPVGWEDDLATDKSQAIQSLLIKGDMMKSLQVWAAQNYYLAYNNALINKEDLQSSRDLLQKNVIISKLQSDLGMATSLDVKAAESFLEDADLALKVLNDTLSSIRGELNLLLGQDYSTPLVLDTVPLVDEKSLDSMDYKKDQRKASDKSFNILLAQTERWIKNVAQGRAEDRAASRSAIKQAEVEWETAEIKYSDEKMKLDKDFDTVYNEVLNKKRDLKREQEKLADSQEQYDVLSLKHTLGMTSQVEFDRGAVTYNSQANKVKSAENDLFKAYQAYDWLLKGLSTDSASGAESQGLSTGSSE